MVKRSIRCCQLSHLVQPHIPLDSYGLTFAKLILMMDYSRGHRSFECQSEMKERNVLIFAMIFQVEILTNLP